MGSALIEAAPKEAIVFATHRNRPVSPPARGLLLNLTDEAALRSAVREARPQLILHTAANTDVEWCETHPLEAQSLHLSATLALRAAAPDAKLVYISTNSVFDGRQGWYTEGDATAPLNVYSQSKLSGESAALPQDLVVRTTFYGLSSRPTQESFALRVIRRLRAGEKVSAAVDQVSNHLHVRQVAQAIYALCEANAKGVIHLGATEALSTYELAKMIARQFELDDRPIERTTLNELAVRFQWKARRASNLSLNPKRASEVVSLSSPAESLALLQADISRL